MVSLENEYDLNVEKSKMSEFRDALMGRLGQLCLSDEELEALDLTLDEVRFPMLVLGVGGTSKTASVIACVNRINKTIQDEDKKFGFKSIKLGQLVVGDLTGIPVVMPDGTVKRVMCDDLPEADPTKPDFKEYGVLFLDEITTVDEAQMQPALGLADDSRSIGTYKLPEHWFVVAAGNGPDCSNFMRLDDVMISRFEVFDTVTEYKEDFRQWAQTEGHIREEIIAFLNFDDSHFTKPISDPSVHDPKIGHSYSAARPWKNLNSAIKIYMSQHKGEFWPQEEIAHRASRIIGKITANDFAAFCAFRSKVDYDPKKILAGTEKDPDMDMPKEVFHIITERCVKQLIKDLAGKGKESKVDGGDWSYPKECFEEVANFVIWLMNFEQTNLENCLQAFILMREGSEDVVNILVNSVFESYCPVYAQFLERNYEYFIENQIS